MNRFFCGLAFLSVAGCATPEVVDVKKTDDDNLTCEQIDQQIAEAKEFEKAARDEKGVTGTNVAAAILFFPGLFATYANADEAIDAARDRQDHLFRLRDQRDCQSPSENP